MKQDLSARVLLLHNGSIHIALANLQTFECSAAALADLFDDPFSFYQNHGNKYRKTTAKVCPRRIPLEEIPGITLASVDNENTVTCEFPILLDLVFQALREGREREALSLSDLTDKTSFADQKEYLLHMFLSSSSLENEDLTLKNGFMLSLEFKSRIFKEIFNYHASKLVVETIADNTEVATTQNLAQMALQTKVIDIPEHYVNVETMARLKNRSPNTIREQIRQNKRTSVMRDDLGHFWLDPNEEPEDRRAGRTMPEQKQTGDEVELTARGTPAKTKRMKGKSFEDVQKWLAKRNMFSEELRQYIRLAEEARYYEEHHYHESTVNGAEALLIDITPEYVCTKQGTANYGKSNRQIIEGGGSPVVPKDEDNIYNLHHVGQKRTSPFAIIPSKDHNGPELYTIFHPEPSDDEDIHDTTFEMQKKAFWKEYLNIYDAYGSFMNIPFRHIVPPAKKKRS